VNERAVAGQAWQRPVKTIPAANQKMLGREVAEQAIIAQADAGMSPERIERVQDEIAARNLSEATTPETTRFAREYDHTARTLLRDLRDMERGELCQRLRSAAATGGPGFLWRVPAGLHSWSRSWASCWERSPPAAEVRRARPDRTGE